MSETSKPYHLLTPAEKLANRIAKNREIDRRVSEQKTSEKKPSAVGARRKAVSDVLDKFQEIKRSQGIDAASDFVLNRKK